MNNNLLPIENLPAETPRCPWCNRKLRPVVDETHQGRRVAFGKNAEIDRRVFLRWNAYDGIFDRLVCARSFAVAAYQAGFRRTR